MKSSRRAFEPPPRRSRRLALLVDERQQAYLEAVVGEPLTVDAVIVLIADLRLEARRSRRREILRALGLRACRFRGPVRRWHRSLATELERLDAELG